MEPSPRLATHCSRGSMFRWVTLTGMAFWICMMRPTKASTMSRNSPAIVLRTIPVTGSGGQSIAIMFGNGDGTFQSATSGPIAPSNGEVQFDQMRLGDFNNDGKLDVIVGAKRTFLLLQK